VREVVAVGGIMAVKDSMTQSLAATDDVRDVAPVTPEEYIGARSWDGAIAPYYRLMLGAHEYRQVSDGLGGFASASSCSAIQRAIDNIMRYNDITDAVADYVHHESFNQLLLALAIRDGSIVVGYGTALAEVTDTVLACRCGQAGHDEAAELSMGACMWYALTPRYHVRRQLAAFSHTDSDIAEAYAVPGRDRRRTACVLRPGTNLHSPTWEPEWEPAEDRSIDERAQRVSRRSLAEDVDPLGCAAIAREVLARRDRAEDDDSLRQLGQGWQQVFDTALDVTGTARGAHATALRNLIDSIWGQSVLGHGTKPGTDARLLMDVDEAIRATFGLAGGDGPRLRRAFFGVASGAVELAGLNPFARLADGVARVY
jgi:hypothetical protein